MRLPYGVGTVSFSVEIAETGVLAAPTRLKTHTEWPKAVSKRRPEFSEGWRLEPFAPPSTSQDGASIRPSGPTRDAHSGFPPKCIHYHGVGLWQPAAAGTGVLHSLVQATGEPRTPVHPLSSYPFVPISLAVPVHIARRIAPLPCIRRRTWDRPDATHSPDVCGRMRRRSPPQRPSRASGLPVS